MGDVVFNLLLVVHLVALGVGAATVFAMPLVVSRVRGASAEGREMLGGIAAQLLVNSRFALGVLVAGGALMTWWRYGGVAGLGPWFWMKMGLVAVILAVTAVGILAPRGSISPALLGWTSRLALLGVVIAAAFAFS
ncbi:MAG: hypothetical protein U1E56_00840 [Bauldia sp.]